MKPTPTCHDEALLLFLHNELPPVARLRLLVHLIGCPACRTSLRDYRRISAQLAQGLGQPGRPPRLLPSSRAHAMPAPLPIILALSLLIFASLGLVFKQWHAANPSAFLPAAAQSQDPLKEDCIGPEIPPAPARKKP
jgi:anti-sigma factor RsiW